MSSGIQGHTETGSHWSDTTRETLLQALGTVDALLEVSGSEVGEIE